jgi:hypothetical protein
VTCPGCCGDLPDGIAWALGGQGRVDEAFTWFDQALEERDSLVALLHSYTEPFAPCLARDPRFAALLEKLGIADVGGARP